jgi:His/Glu/Gln/Arg/opine family amino acid ABC transporter permease subunit
MEYAAMNIILYLPLLLQGSLITLKVWLIASSISLIIGTCAGILSCNHLASPRRRMFFQMYTFIAKGIPAYVQILIAYFVIPAILGINLSGLVAATLALAFCSSGYVTEIVRSGINTISHGQWDACFVLGYSLKATLFRIILPQTFRNILPGLLGEIDKLLKSTSLLATIGITELIRTGMNIISRELNPVPIYSIIACIYLLFSAILQAIIMYSEKKAQYGNR